MLIKTLNLTFIRLSSKGLSINRLLSSQIVKTKEEMAKTVSTDHSKDTQISVENKVEDQKSLAERHSQAIKQVIKSPVQMDSHWEMNAKEIEYKKIKFKDQWGGISSDILAALHHKFDISIPGLKRRIKYYINFREQYNQRYIRKRHAILGPELATAHFVTYRGGFVRFRHAPNVWISDVEEMPNVYDSKYRLIDCNASNLRLRYEAMDNFILLDSLQSLNLSKNPLLDDFCCDKLSRLFRNSKTLTVLDLSDNPLITNRGVEALHRIRSLKKLVISGTKAAKYPFIELLIILFNDVNPNCHIVV